MRLRLPSCRSSFAARSGVALIVTIIMISVITFLTVAFLALSGREKNSVKTATNQTTARLAADHAIERAKSDMLTGLLATRDASSIDLLVSTNYINYQGFFPGAVDGSTNVNFDYAAGGGALSSAQYLQNLANLLYDPRPPVFITNRLGGSNEFRYYLDLNRNRRHDLTGLWPEYNQFGLAVVNPTNAFLTNFVWQVGDPEWVGVLERPNQSHSPSNRFVYRYAYVALPEGKTLDVNYIYNAAGTRSLAVNNEGFFRNQGVAPWEMNLAGFFSDLNTNLWNPVGNPYDYRLPTTGLGNRGAAFEDAQSLLSYRYANNYNSLALGYPGFLNNQVDEYSDGPWLTIPNGLPAENDVTVAWAGSDNPNHYFSVQDFFDPTKTSVAFVNRLNLAGASPATYDQTTFYRMLAQLGTASAPESSDKLNLNYVNVGGLAATNFYRWTDSLPGALGAIPNSLLFFTNAVDRLLREYSEDWLATDYSAYTNTFRMDRSFSITNIPVIISNQWVYSPAVHRVLQLAANLWETKTTTSNSPTVFRPRFRGETFGTNANIYIDGFQPVTTNPELLIGIGNKAAVDLIATNDPVQAIGNNGEVLVYGAPPVIGARKGLPNFNEFASEMLVSVTRKLQVRKAGKTITQTNQVFAMEVQVPMGVEFWNSYATNFNQPVSIYVTNVTSMTMTNDLGVNFTKTFVMGDRVLNTNNWRGYRALNTRDPKSFITMMRTNVPFLPVIQYVPNRGAAGFFATNISVWDDSQQLLMPRWGVTISNRIHGMILDGAGRILDYVVLGNMAYVTNLTDIIASSSSLTTAQFGDGGVGGTPNAFKQLWATNQFGALVSGRIGVIQQINISVGAVPFSGKWESYGKFSPNAPTLAAAEFNYFMYSADTNGLATVPFTPSFQFRVPLSWQANDPLVHYLSGDLFDTQSSGIVALIDPAQLTPVGQLPGLGTKNTRYQPWPIDSKATEANAYAADLKDPQVRASDDWLFPTNVLPNIGWLGRIHRGTPWQTVYLKASDLGWTNPAAGFSPTGGWLSDLTDRGPALRWSQWAGNRNILESYYYRPVMDRVLFDVFTTAINDNSTRGRLNINQTNLAAWSAVFSGVVALTNTATTSPVYGTYVIDPAGVYDPLNANTWSPLVRLYNGINTLRANPYYFPTRSFQKLGDILAVPELSDASPFLNRATTSARNSSITDAAYEWLPQQTLSLLQLEPAPRFSVYAYGQALQPAPDSVRVSNPFSGLCTNYAITAEVALRAVVRVEGSSDPSKTNTFLPAKKRYPPHVVVESFNYLPPE